MGTGKKNIEEDTKEGGRDNGGAVSSDTKEAKKNVLLSAD